MRKQSLVAQSSGMLRWGQFLGLCLALGGIALPALGGPASPGFTNFDLPGSFALPTRLNNSGDIAGSYTDSSGAHGFLRTSNGKITTFNAPEAAGGTYPVGINDSGTIAGYYYDTSQRHGFLRTSNGKITTFNVPGTVGGIIVTGINGSGAIAGYGPYDGNDVDHGILRSGDTAIFDVPLNPGQTATGVFAHAVNDFGQIAGWFHAEQETVNCGPICCIPQRVGFKRFFRRDPGPPSATYFIDVPDLYEAFGVGMNNLGQIAGAYFDSSFVAHSFLWDPSSGLTTFDIPGAGTGYFSFAGTFAVSINDSGAIAGHYTEDSNVTHGFVRSPSGDITVIDNPSADFPGTYAGSINNSGAIVGSYTTGGAGNPLVYHGFLYTP